MASADVQTQPHAPHSLDNASILLKPNSSKTHDVQTELNYYFDDGKPPAPAIVGKPETYERPHDTRKVVVHDVRGHESEHNLDTTGFQFLRHESVEKAFEDEEQIKTVYYPEVEQILKDTTGATKVYIFDHTIRRTPKDRSAEKAAPLRGPVQRVHIDQTYRAAEDRVRHHFPDPVEHEQLLKGRFQIINLWRPIKTIRKDPLGVAAANSVPDTDLVGVDLVYPDRRGETYTVRPNDKHQWYYLRDQRPDEPLLIKCFDSLTDGRARRVPHSAFVDPSTENEESRESIEVRTLVFYEQ